MWRPYTWRPLPSGAHQPRQYIKIRRKKKLDRLRRRCALEQKGQHVRTILSSLLLPAMKFDTRKCKQLRGHIVHFWSSNIDWDFVDIICRDLIPIVSECAAVGNPQSYCAGISLHNETRDYTARSIFDEIQSETTSIAHEIKSVYGGKRSI